MLVIHYGPYEAHGVIRHKIQRIRGLLDCLNNENYLVEIVASPHLNRISIFLLEREIFRGDIRFLPFNLYCNDDPICQKILSIIRLHEQMFSQANNIPKFESIKKGIRWPCIQMTQDIPLKLALNSDISILFEVGTKLARTVRSNEEDSEEQTGEVTYPEIGNEFDDNYWDYNHTSDYLLKNLLEPVAFDKTKYEDTSTDSTDVTIISEEPSVVITCFDEICRICKGEELVIDENVNEEEINDESNEIDFEIKNEELDGMKDIDDENINGGDEVNREAWDVGEQGEGRTEDAIVKTEVTLDEKWDADAFQIEDGNKNVSLCFSGGF